MTFGCNCGRQWRGLSQAHCPTCHAHFGSVDGFDRHRAGTGGCHDPATMADKQGAPVYNASEGPFGTTWVRNRPGGHYRATPATTEKGGA